jgi:hypothetical protein
MELHINKSTKFFVPVSANSATGGPELLHQLVYNLRIIGFDAYMYYIPNNHPQPIHKEYVFYNNPFVREIEDDSNNVIITPEIFDIIKLFKNYNKIQKVVWWLSVHNFFVSRSVNIFPYNLCIYTYITLNKILGRPIFDVPNLVMYLNRRFKSKDESLIDDIKVHLAQSHYACESLKSVGIANEMIHYLSDYLNDDFLNIHFDVERKEDIVLYNPSKGYGFTKKIINHTKGCTFIAITNMSRSEVRSLMLRSKVYIDFGNHPGKDRMPREAAMAGCCVITGLRGSAIYGQDVNILKKYKFKDKSINLEDISNCINKCITDYSNQIKDFEHYRNIICNEKSEFLEDVKKLFVLTDSISK